MSSTTESAWAEKLRSGCTALDEYGMPSMSQMQTVPSSAALSRRPFLCGFQHNPYPSCSCPSHRSCGLHSLPSGWADMACGGGRLVWGERVKGGEIGWRRRNRVEGTNWTKGGWGVHCAAGTRDLSYTMSRI